MSDEFRERQERIEEELRLHWKDKSPRPSVVKLKRMAFLMALQETAQKDLAKGIDSFIVEKGVRIVDDDGVPLSEKINGTEGNRAGG